MQWILIFLCFSSCIVPKPSNAIEELSENVIKKKEGVKITVEPIDEKGK